MRVVVESETGTRTEYRAGRGGERAIAAPAAFRRGAADSGGAAGVADREADVYGVVAAPAAFADAGAATGARSLPDDVP